METINPRKIKKALRKLKVPKLKIPSTKTKWYFLGKSKPKLIRICPLCDYLRFIELVKVLEDFPGMINDTFLQQGDRLSLAAHKFIESGNECSENNQHSMFL